MGISAKHYLNDLKDAVTLFGESCGAASVGYHLLSPHSKIYFNRAVMASGLPGEDYSFVHPNVLRQRSRKLAKFAGCDIKKATIIINFAYYHTL